MISRCAVAAVSTSLALAACSGGSSSPNQPPTARFSVAPAGGAAPLRVTFDASASSDGDGSIAAYAWDFGDGGVGRGSNVSHTFERKGVFTVRLTVTDDENAAASASEELLVNANPLARIVADPVGGAAPLTVTFDGGLSADADGAIVSYAWRFGADAQGAQGASATRTFSAPGLYAARLTVTDDLGGSGEAVFEVNVRDPAQEDIDYAVPYAEDGDHAADLNPCLYAYDTDAERCAMARLPFLGAEFAKPTVEDVMSRALVSHRWMGDNLRTLLALLPEDALLLARSLTGIVVATDIRPAHFRPTTGAIYLDAEFFWRTAEQLAVVSREPDFRAAFQRRLQLQLPWRFVRNNQPLRIRRDDNGARLLQEGVIWLGFLLFHELSHAADFMQFSRMADVDPSWTPLEAMIGGTTEAWRGWPSFRLNEQHPLRSGLMSSLAQVSFGGEDPTPAQAALQPQDIVDDFAGDGAVDYYSYFSPYEDLADLHTAALMSYHFGYEQDTAITDNPTQDDAPLTVAWGQRGRLADALVIDRTRFVLEAMYPGDVQQLVGYVSSRPAPLPLRVGDSWRDNLALDGGERFNSLAPLGALPDGGVAPAAGAMGGRVSNSVAAPIGDGPGGEASVSYFGCIRLEGAARYAQRKQLGL